MCQPATRSLLVLAFVLGLTATCSAYSTKVGGSSSCSVTSEEAKQAAEYCRKTLGDNSKSLQADVLGEEVKEDLEVIKITSCETQVVAGRRTTVMIQLAKKASGGYGYGYSRKTARKTKKADYHIFCETLWQPWTQRKSQILSIQRFYPGVIV